SSFPPFSPSRSQAITTTTTLWMQPTMYSGGKHLASRAPAWPPTATATARSTPATSTSGAHISAKQIPEAVAARRILHCLSPFQSPMHYSSCLLQGHFYRSVPAVHFDIEDAPGKQKSRPAIAGRSGLFENRASNPVAGDRPSDAIS